jgi:hypothetical protein
MRNVKVVVAACKWQNNGVMYGVVMANVSNISNNVSMKAK